MALSPEALEADRRLALELDAKIQVLHASELKIEAQICDLVVIIGERNLFRALEKTSLAKYAKARLGWSAGKTSSVLSLSRLLPERPNLRAAFYAGTLGWSVTYEVALDSTPETEAELTLPSPRPLRGAG